MKILYKKGEEVLGNGKTQIAWRPGGNYLAVASTQGNVYLFDRRGEQLDQIQLTSEVIGLSWDKEGDVIAMICDKNSQLVLWDINTKTTEQLETSMGAKEFPTWLEWSRVSPILAVANNNGNLLIYNHRTARKVPVMGKHQRRITCGAISDTDLIACGSDDATVTVSNLEGDTLHTYSCTSEPTLLQFSDMKRTPDKSQADTTISTIMNKRILMLTNLSDINNPINLQFQPKYGDIIAYQWYNDGYLLIGFEKGNLVCISAHAAELGQEIFSVGDYRTYLSDICVSRSFGKVISAGDNCLKVREMNQLSEMVEMIDVDTDKELSQVRVNDEGSLVAVCSQSGQLSVFLTKVPTLGAAYKDSIAVLSGLNEVTVLPEGQKDHQTVLSIKIEPSVLAIGPRHLAVAANNRVAYYDHINAFPNPVTSAEYLSSVLAVQLNQHFVAVTMDGVVRLHQIVPPSSAELDAPASAHSATFPESSRNTRLVDAHLTDNFLIFTTESQYVVYFSLEEWAVVSEYRHQHPLKGVFPEAHGVRLCLFDDRLDAYIYSPIDDSMFKLPPVGATVHYKACLWETFTVDQNTFVVYDQNSVYSFLLSRTHIGGESIIYCGQTKLPYGHTPLMLSKGIVHCMTSTGKPSGVLLESHKTEYVLSDKPKETKYKLLEQAIALQRWAYAWRVCEDLRGTQSWASLGRAAIQHCNVPFAIRVFRHIGDVSMVWSLREVEDMEERALLAGQLALLVGDFDAAEKAFLESSRPEEALDLRRDLLHWPRALQLAARLDKAQVPHISKEYAQQLEFMGNYPEALQHYEDGHIEKLEEETEEMLEHNETCQAGIARMSIRTGDLRRGVDLARSLEGRVVKRDCAIVLEQMKQFNDAAQLYEMGQFYDRAAAVCLKAKNWGKVAELLPKVRSPKIHAQYGKVMEGERKYKDAAIAYKNARDYDNLVRMLLDHLNMPEEAVKVVRESRSVEGAKLVAAFFTRLNDHASAIQFLVMSQCQQEAFQLAESTDHMEAYAEAISEDATGEQLNQLANHFAETGKPLEAGRYHARAGNWGVALDYLFSLGDHEEAMLLAIQCVAESKERGLIKRLTDFLMGESNDGQPKDAKFLFRMYVALGMTKEAAKTAIIIAREEQNRGSYKIARDLLFAMHQDLEGKSIRVPQEMSHSLMLIHSYLIVKQVIKRGESTRAARMLMRVAANISRFPSHIVQILTSAVVVCTKAGLKQAALKYAVQLMKPENRDKVDGKYKKKIEQIVRKTEKSVDAEEDKTPCPHCETPVEESSLLCSNCKNDIPYCIVTGAHIVADDFSQCPSCSFPAHYSELKRLLASSEICPMCGGSLDDMMRGVASEYLAATSPPDTV